MTQVVMNTLYLVFVWELRRPWLLRTLVVCLRLDWNCLSDTWAVHLRAGIFYWQAVYSLNPRATELSRSEKRFFENMLDPIDRELSALEEMMSAVAFPWHHCVSEDCRGVREWDHPRKAICKPSACFDLWPMAGELCLQQEMMSMQKEIIQVPLLQKVRCCRSQFPPAFRRFLSFKQTSDTITVKQCDQTIRHCARCLPENSMGLVQTHSV